MFKLAGFFLLLLPVKVAYSQPDNLALTALRQEIIGHRFMLRNFSAQPMTRYHYQDLHLVQDAPLIKSAALFEVKDANLQGTLLTLLGQRSVLIEDKEKGKVSVLPQPADASIQVDIGIVDAATAFPQLTDELFFPSVSSALAAIPPYLRRMVPYRINLQPKQSCRDCTHWMRQGGAWQELPPADAGLQNPQVLRSDSAGNPPSIGGNVSRATGSFAFVVDEKGHTTELWLTRPAGHGLDEYWTTVLRKQTFWPAKYHGAQVAVPLAQDMDYQRF